MASFYALRRTIIAALTPRGGGQGVVMFAPTTQVYEIDALPKLLIVSQPTWGVDVGAAAQIRAALVALRDAGCAVLVISEELDELFELSDRMHVMAQGRLSPSLTREQATVDKIGSWMSGLWSTAEETVN